MSSTTTYASPAAGATARDAGRGAIADDRTWRWLTFAPSLTFMMLLAILPLANMLAMSFFVVKWSGGKSTWTFTGLDHYAALPADELFRAGIGNTIVFVVAAVIAEMVIGFALALFCSRVVRGRVLYRTIFILPILIPGIVIGAIWKLMYNADFGLANQILGLVGLPGLNWLRSPNTALLSVIIVDIWHWTPFCFLLLLAGIESLPQDVYEAARIDGASGRQELFLITLPMMVPTIIVTLTFRMIVAFKVFDEVYLLTSGGPGTATEVISYTIYQRFFTEDRTGYGSAMAVATIFVICLFLVLILSTRRRAGANP